MNRFEAVMDLSRRKVGLFVLVQFFLLGKVIPCPYDVLSGNKHECGSIVSPNCPRTCCFDKSENPKCFFLENVYGPIKHPNGLCVNVDGGSDGLIWSKDCTSRNAFFLVSYDHPPFHLASGKCVLPSGKVDDPGQNADLFLSTQPFCNGHTVTYRATDTGNLEYFYNRGSYKLCLGTSKKRGDDGPEENDPFSIPASACSSVGSCTEQLSYVYERKFDSGNVNFKCVLGRTIKIVWANYGLQAARQYPLNISTSNPNCVTTTATSFVRKMCDGKIQCFFSYQDSDFLSSSCTGQKILLVRHTCKMDAVSAAPSSLDVSVENDNKLFVMWSNDANNNGVSTKFKICWTKIPDHVISCCNLSSSDGLPSKTVMGLTSATRYNVTVARYSCDEKIIGIKAHEIVTTRSVPLNVKEIFSTSFKIKLGALQSDDRYAQIVVSKLGSKTKPADHPQADQLKAYDEIVDNVPYIAAELDKSHFIGNRQFTVGDGKTYDRSNRRKRRNSNKFLNVKLQPNTFYSVFQRTFQTQGLYYDSDWMDVIETKTLPPSATPLPPTSDDDGSTKGTSDGSTKGGVSTTGSISRDTTTKESGGLDPLSDGQDDGSGGGSNIAIIGAAAGGGVLLIVLIILVIIFIRRRSGNSSSNTHLYDKPVIYKNSKKTDKLNENQENQNTLSSSDGRGENPIVFSSDRGGDTPFSITAPSGDVYAKPIKKKHVPESEYQNGRLGETYANLHVECSDEDKGVNISRFLFYVEEMKKDKDFRFQNEFKELPVGQTHPWEEGRKIENVPKNRYANNAAYDHSRVVLSGEENYINANFIKGVNSEIYIAAQGPTEKTVNDFWRMIWEHNCSCIIALTNIVELGKVKCVQYWSDDETDFGQIHVKTVKTELFADYIIRYIDIKKGDKGKKISQYHFTSWPDHGVPKYPTKLLAFRRRFRALHTVSAQPIVVHCSAGVGRTGTFIALDIILLRLNQLNEQTINIRDTVHDLRNKRVNMVQTLEQYVLVHEAVLEMVLCGFTEIEAENLKTEIERFEQKELNKSFTGFEIEFKKLASVCHPLTPEECKAALNEKNKSKNRDSSIYPSENLRVFLCGSKADEDPYINASYIHGYTHARAYIATQAPLPNTINDFWQMVFEKKAVVVVMLNNVSEGKTVYPQYWPEDFNHEKQYGRLFVKMVSAETRGPIISRKFVITNKNQNAAVKEHVVRHVQFTDWPEHGVPGNHNDVMDLLDSVEEAQQRSTNGVVIVHCSNGAHRTGTYLTLAIQRDRVRTEHVVDIFRCIKMLREQRPQFVGNVDQYKFCYDAMLTFVEAFKTYDNIPKVQKE